MLQTAHVEGLNLGNLDDRVNEQFADAMREIVHLFHDESQKFETGTRKARITVEIDFEHKLETRTTVMSVGVSSKLPKYRKSANTLRAPRGGDRFLIEIEDSDQVDLFHHDNPGDSAETKEN